MATLDNVRLPYEGKGVRCDGRRQRASVRTLWRLDVNDDSHYTAVLDASRLPDDASNPRAARRRPPNEQKGKS
jgi:hypothetical protein